MENQKPIVTLIDYTKHPFNLAVASARTCYSSKGLLYPEDMTKSEKAIEIRDKVAKSTKKAGHLTTRQHPQFIFAIDKVSRHFVWSFLHSHPFYNSEQVSQRYVEVKTENYYIPVSLTETLKQEYILAIENGTKAYTEFIHLIKPYVEKEYFAIYKARANYPEKWQEPIKKRSIEVARYFLPLATHTYLYHTINGLTLHRYYRLVNRFDVPEEQKLVVGQMIEEVRKIDPLFIEEMDDSIPLEETPEYIFFQNQMPKQDSTITAEEFIHEFDRDLKDHYSVLESWSSNAEKNLARSVRAVLGVPESKLNDMQALRMILDPSQNPQLGSSLNETTLSHISRCMYHVHYTFKKRISHTADSQDQRHRMVPASRPVLYRQYTGKPDFITPRIVKKYDDLHTAYKRYMDKIFQGVNAFIAAGGNIEHAMYLLPNAFPIRFYESGDLLNLHHKYKSRTCFNAQEEIFYASVDEIHGITSVHPEIAKWLRSPCWLRFQADTKPVCPEGNKYCGIQVWKKDLNEYERVI